MFYCGKIASLYFVTHVKLVTIHVTFKKKRKKEEDDACLILCITKYFYSLLSTCHSLMCNYEFMEVDGVISPKIVIRMLGWDDT